MAFYAHEAFLLKKMIVCFCVTSIPTSTLVEARNYARSVVFGPNIALVTHTLYLWIEHLHLQLTLCLTPAKTFHCCCWAFRLNSPPPPPPLPLPGSWTKDSPLPHLLLGSQTVHPLTTSHVTGRLLHQLSVLFALQNKMSVPDEKEYVLTETPVKSPTKQTARMKFGGDTKKLLLKQIRKRIRSSAKKQTVGFPRSKEFTTIANYQKKVPQSFQTSLSNNMPVLPVKKQSQGPSKSESNCALKEDNKVTSPPVKKRAKGAQKPTQAKERIMAKTSEKGASDNDNENIPLSQLKQMQKSKIGARKFSQPPNKRKMDTERKSAKKVDDCAEDARKPVKFVDVQAKESGYAPVVQVVDISPLIDRRKVTQSADVTETASLASESTRSRDADFTDLEYQSQYSEGVDPTQMFPPEECDDYELVQVMARTDIPDCCPPTTSPEDKVSVFSFARGQMIHIPRSHPAIRPAPLPRLEDLDIPDVVREDLVRHQTNNNTVCARKKELTLQCGNRCIRVPAGGPRYPVSTLRYLSKMQRTHTEYWRLLHTPYSRNTKAKEFVFGKTDSPGATSKDQSTQMRKFCSFLLSLMCTRQSYWSGAF